MRRLLAAVVLLGLMLLTPEAVLEWRFWGWRELTEIRPLQARGAHTGTANACEVQLELFPGRWVPASLDCSGGSSDYCTIVVGRRPWLLYLRSAHGLTARLRIWVEPARPDGARILTYQPAMGPNQDGNEDVDSGFALWTFDGTKYQPRMLYVPRLNLWLRDPLGIPIYLFNLLT